MRSIEGIESADISRKCINDIKFVVSISVHPKSIELKGCAEILPDFVIVTNYNQIQLHDLYG